jgi:hypothetical protein
MDNFLYQETLADVSICKKIIEFYQKSDNKNPGTCYNLSGVMSINKDYKDSSDVTLENDDEIFISYYKQLQSITDNYVELFPSCNFYASWGIKQSVNIQHYSPNGGFKVWHTERATASEPMSSRHLVFMTYLNDVTDCGETEFFNQKIKVSPKEGLTLIWPADWTYTHRGIPSPTQDKYIITGWFNFLN